MYIVIYNHWVLNMKLTFLLFLHSTTFREALGVLHLSAQRVCDIIQYSCTIILKRAHSRLTAFVKTIEYSGKNSGFFLDSAQFAREIKKSLEYDTLPTKM